MDGDMCRLSERRPRKNVVWPFRKGTVAHLRCPRTTGEQLQKPDAAHWDWEGKKELLWRENITFVLGRVNIISHWILAESLRSHEYCFELGSECIINLCQKEDYLLLLYMFVYTCTFSYILSCCGLNEYGSHRLCIFECLVPSWRNCLGQIRRYRLVGGSEISKPT